MRDTSYLDIFAQLTGQFRVKNDEAVVQRFLHMNTLLNRADIAEMISNRVGTVDEVRVSLRAEVERHILVGERPGLASSIGLP